MKRIHTVAVACLALIGSTAVLVLAQEPAAPASTAPQLPDLKSKVSYIIGQNMGKQMAKDKMEIDMATFTAGLKDGLAGAKSALSDAEMQAVIKEFSEAQQLKENAQLKEQSEKNNAEGAAFLAANGKKEGVKTLESGVQYKVVKEGTGATPKLTDTVTTHYKGTLLDGKVFDSSYERGQPATFPVNGVIPGWTEILQKMKVGDKWEIYIPGSRAYGLRGTPDGSIGPNALLTFEIELIAVEAGK
ncbi:MAG: FKBP-type peptidyl-prolyl cis-trans isomerase [Planctomycetia bacterium]|nr:FKBP-type peptidyl-prolyl cis-trans isomerase [Planctomycetia bacterium]